MHHPAARILHKWRRLRKKKSATSVTNILDLPRELRDMISAHLPLHSKISLRLSCRSLCFSGPLLPILFYQIRKSPDLRYELHLMLERDSIGRRGWSREQLSCSRCRSVHDQRSFDSWDYQMNPNERCCVGSQGHVCHMPGSSMDFFAFQKLLRSFEFSPVRARADWYYERQISAKTLRYLYAPSRPSSTVYSCGELEARLSETWTNVNGSFQHRACYWFLLSSISDIRASSANVLKFGINLQRVSCYALCPHQNLGAVLQAAFGSRLQYELYQAPREIYACRKCLTSVVVDKDKIAESFFRVFVVRDFGSVKSATDPMWLGQMEL